MLKLPRVTLCAFGSTNIEGMKKALEYSSRGIEFGDVKLIEHPCNGIEEWNKNIVFELGDYIKTDFALLIHPDGYVVHPESWNDEWLNYDYIGSPWPLPSDNYSYRDVFGNIRRVGNSVSLRSKKLLDLPKKLNLPWKEYYGNTNEDGFLCCHNAHILEENGCKFAPLSEAVHFGREHDIPENENIRETFIFHQHWSPRNRKYEIFEKNDHSPTLAGVSLNHSPEGEK